MISQFIRYYSAFLYSKDNPERKLDRNVKRIYIYVHILFIHSVIREMCTL